MCSRIPWSWSVDVYWFSLRYLHVLIVLDIVHSSPVDHHYGTSSSSLSFLRTVILILTWFSSHHLILIRPSLIGRQWISILGQDSSWRSWYLRFNGCSLSMWKWGFLCLLKPSKIIHVLMAVVGKMNSTWIMSYACSTCTEQHERKNIKALELIEACIQPTSKAWVIRQPNSFRTGKLFEIGASYCSDIWQQFDKIKKIKYEHK